MDDCPCPCGHTEWGGRCIACGGSGISSIAGDTVCDLCNGSGIEAGRTKEGKIIIAEMQKFPPGEDEEEGPFVPFSMSEWQMVKGPKKRHATHFEDGDDWSRCVDCGGDGKDKGLYDHLCDTHGGAQVEEGACTVHGLQPGACKFTSRMGEDCGNCKGSGLDRKSVV